MWPNRGAPDSRAKGGKQPVSAVPLLGGTVVRSAAVLSCDLPEHHSGHRCFSVPGGMGGELGLVLLKRTPLRLETQPPKPAIGALVISFP
jgi:hypothetical protein